MHSAGRCASGVGLSKILKRAELDWPVLSYLDLDICSYAMCLTRDDVHGWEGRPWRKSIRNTA